MKNSNIAKFFFELGQAKHVKRSGWWLAGIKDPESIAEHMWRATILGKFIANQEGADQNKVVTMLLFHDIAEIRIGDIHKVGQRYLKKKEAESFAFEDQIKNLPMHMAKEISVLEKERSEQKTKEAMIAKDADLLECAMQAKEYKEQGYISCQDWMQNVKKQLKTKSAKELFAALENEPSTSWWGGLKELD